MIFTSTSRACAARDGAITSQTGVLLWEHDSSQVFLLYLWQLHSTHESYFMLLLFANRQCWASIFNNISYQMSGKTRWNRSAKKTFVANCFFFFTGDAVWALFVDWGHDWIKISQSSSHIRPWLCEEQHRKKIPKIPKKCLWLVWWVFIVYHYWVINTI